MISATDLKVLPILGKIIEYFVNKQLIDLVDNNKILTEQQYGFRKN